MRLNVFSDCVAVPIAPGRFRRISQTIEEMMTLHSAPPTTDPTMFDDEDNMSSDEIDVLCDSRRDVHDVKSVITVTASEDSLGDVSYTDVVNHTSGTSSASASSETSSEQQ